MFSYIARSKRIVGGRTIVFIFGGYDGISSTYKSVIQRYDGTNISTDAATLASVITSHSTSAIGSNSFIFGGDDTTAPLNTIQKYTGTTRSTVNILYSVNRYSSSCTIGSNAFIFGGNDNVSSGTKSNTIQRYDGTTRSIDSATLASVNINSSAATIGSNAFIFGGYSSTYLNTIQKYDGTTRSTDSSSMSTSLTQVNACLTTDSYS